MDTRQEILDIRKKLQKKYADELELFPELKVGKSIPTIPTGSVILNALTGVGGFPRGRIVEIYGAFSTGKTTIAIDTMVALHKSDPEANILFVDYEHAFDPVYATRLGLNLNGGRFIFAQPSTFEQGADVIDNYVEAGLVDLVVIDSAAAMTPAAEMEGAVDSTGRIGLQAQLMSKLLNKMTKKMSKPRYPSFLILNQTRTKIDIKRPGLTREDAAGGMAMKFFTTIRMELETFSKDGTEYRKKDSRAGGVEQMFTRSNVRVTVTKNKVGVPFLRGNLVIDFGKGINNIISIADMAEERLGISTGAGYYKYQGDTPETTFSVRGREQFRNLLEQSPELVKELEKKIQNLYELESRKILEGGDYTTIMKEPETSGIVMGDEPTEKLEPMGIKVEAEPTASPGPMKFEPEPMPRPELVIEPEGKGAANEASPDPIKRRPGRPRKQSGEILIRDI